MFDFQEELRKLPDQPGVYIMHDKTDAIIYIGKAVSLRKRVRQYFQPSHDEGIKKKQMVEHIARFGGFGAGVQSDQRAHAQI